MEPRTSRLQPSCLQNEPTTAAAGTSRVALSPPGMRGPSRVTETNILGDAYGMPSLYASPDPHVLSSNASKQCRPASRHGRSMSHPFPSLFQSKEKRQECNATTAFDSTDEDTLSLHFQSPSKGNTGRLTRVPDKDLITGKCMTCDSTVRWPKELSVFRCTVCLTINDLKPVVVDAARGDVQKSHTVSVSGTHAGPASFSKVEPLSSVRTRALIEQCLTSYLSNRLEHGNEYAVSEKKTPPSYPSIDSEEVRLAGQRECFFHTSKTKGCQNTFTVPASQNVGRPGFGFEKRSCHVHHKSQNGINPNLYSTSTSYSYDSHLRNMVDGFSCSDSREEASIRGQKLPQELRDNGDNDDTTSSRRGNEGIKNIFKPLDDYIITSFTSRECVNISFTTLRPMMAPRAPSEGAKRTVGVTTDEIYHRTAVTLSEMDAKTLLIGDFAENGSWWSGSREPGKVPDRSRSHHKNVSMEGSACGTDLVSLKSPRIDWTELREWYRMVLHAGDGWRRHLNDLLGLDSSDPLCGHPSTEEVDEMENQILEAQAHTQRVMLKATESLLKRPGAPLKEPGDIRFLLIILENPLLNTYTSSLIAKHRTRSRSKSRERRPSNTFVNLEPPRLAGLTTSPASSQDHGPGQHSGIIKRLLGLLSNLPNECHHHLVTWFARFSESHFQRTTDLVGSFVTYRLTRQHGKRRGTKHDPTGGLVPSLAASGQGASAALHVALGVSGKHSKQSYSRFKPVVYNDDWQIKAAARVMALLFSANSGATWKGDLKLSPSVEGSSGTAIAAREGAHRHGQILATSSFYNSFLDYSDLIADFEAWEARRGKFAFCQYPFFLSIWAKIQIMEHDARRQMEVKAREAFFDSIMTRKAVNQYLVLRIRRDCLVEDSLKGVSEVVGTGGEEIKKGLRIEFKGEEGIDAGGLRKEWFLLLVRDVFNPEHGMFIYDEDSQFCYFNPYSFETSDQFFLVGVVLGLAIYNSTILDVALPPFAFRKLLAAGPTAAPGAPSHAKLTMTYSLEDLAELRPALANGLRRLLEYDGDVEGTFCRDFVADIERYGQIVQVPLCLNGETTPVTNANRREFVDLYVRYLLDTAVTRQFEPFKRGFFTVCGGNALSLFRPEEIELLIRGSDEPLDITSLRAVAICENWGVPNPAETEPVIGWFWHTFEIANPKDQRKLLSFITGSDRIPAMGAVNLVIKLSCLGDDSSRYPVARTCFNMLSLWRYGSRQKLETMLWRAVTESEGFGLK